MSDDLAPTAATVGRTRSRFELEYEATLANPFAELGDPEEGGVVLLEDVLGTGGMGVVQTGFQPALRRRVAVKRPVVGESEDSATAVLAFLREAWISAKLDHPNVVPVHTLASELGEPRLVMKRVEGVSWRVLLDDDALATEHGMRDRLAFHLSILGRVCRAVHFAHSHGIVHLDLKPANVMVGRHGEVYLLDWGIAAGFRDDAEPWIPRTSELLEVRGTPAYLSPEQARGMGLLLGPRTDVFLLGGLVHRVITGHPPNRGETVDDVLAEARRRKPPSYSPDVPAELVAIVQRAMARNPDDRFASAEALRVALLEFVQHRHSGSVLDAARTRLSRLWAAVSGGPADALAPAVAARLENECRFGVEEALTSWPGNERARATLVELARVVVERALREGDWRRAAAAMERLPSEGDELYLRVRALREEEKERARERQALNDLGSHQDILRNAFARSSMASAGSVAWLAWFVGVRVAEHTGFGGLTYPRLFGSVALATVVYGAVLLAVQKTLLATQIDRRALLLGAASLLGAVVLFGLCAVMGLDAVQATALGSGVSMFFFVAITMSMERRLAWITSGLALFALGGFFDPAHMLEWQAAVGLLGGSALAAIWQRDAISREGRRATSDR